jgi:alkylation response protein AidB-like acyl-CoA dehydrogenase
MPSATAKAARSIAPRHEVTTPTGFKEAYRQFVDGGWPSLPCDPEYGGQGLPIVLHNSVAEMFNSANQAWYMYPGLSHGAYECLHEHGTPEQKALYLPKLVAGEWTGTMCLTEPHCGTDLGLLRSKALPQADGSYRITGNKIFISAGEHDHVGQHPAPGTGAPARGAGRHQGNFPVLVPKFLPDAEGKPGVRNTIHCDALEEKMGIHGNSTCQISLDDATGWLIGEPNKGLNAMFVMMNAARLGVGMQSLGLTEVAYQNAVATPASACRCAACPASRRPTSRPIRSSCIPTCGACC